MVYNRRGKLIRIVYLVISSIVWMFTLGGRLFLNKNIVLCYHSISESHVRLFERQLITIANRIQKIDKNVKSPLRTFSKPQVILTFDDAFLNFYQNAFPIIREKKIPAYVFVVTGDIGKKPSWLKGSGHEDEFCGLMDEKKIKLITNNSKVIIGSHTHNHIPLSNLDIDHVEDELNKSKHILESIVENKIEILAFPHGVYNRDSVFAATRMGFRYMLSLDEKFFDQKQKNGLIGRFLMEPDVWPIEFILTVDGSYSWIYYLRKTIRFLKQF